MSAPNDYEPQFQTPKPREPQPLGQVFAALLRYPPMNLSVLGAVFFLVNVILLPSGAFFNLIFAVLAAVIVYQQVRQAELVVALRKSTAAPTALYERQVLAKPGLRLVFGQVFRSVFNLIFLVAILFTAYGLFIYATVEPTSGQGVIASIALILAYLFFILSNGYARAQVVTVGGKPMPLM